jgi:GTPase SAR1 family protein
VRAIVQELAQGEPAAGTSAVRIAELPPVGVSQEPILYIREPELPLSAIVGLTGDSGSGKSTLATAWIRDAIAQDIPVLVLDRENPRPVALDRMNRLGLADSPLLRWYGGWNGEIPAPASREVLEWVRSCDTKPLIIIDSLIAFLGGDENDASVMRGFMNGARQLTDLGATVVTIHHDGKSTTAQDFRGSSDFKAALDQAFHITNITSDGKLDRLSLRCYKSRYGFSGSLIYNYAGGLFLRDERVDAPARTAADQLTSILRTNPGITSREFDELSAKAGVARSRARVFLDNGILSGEVRREIGAKNQRRHYLAEAR